MTIPPRHGLPCSFPECGRPKIAHGLCEPHNRQRSRGRPLTKITKGLSLAERFWAKVDKKGGDDCWNWLGGTDGKGYGQIIARFATPNRAHRVAYELYYDLLLPSEISLDHRCRNRRCCNPKHLDMVSLSCNIERMLAYKSLKGEIKRLRELVAKLGGDPGPPYNF